MNLSFENKVALVTSAGLGMGLATAKAFAEAGAPVILADINENSVKAVADELTAAGHQVLAIRCDVSNEASVTAMVENLLENSELVIVPGERHIDLYDDVTLIPLDNLEAFFTETLTATTTISKPQLGAAKS